MLEKIQTLIKEKSLCVLSTVAENAVPHCSLMAYTTDEACREIYLVTSGTTSKYKNMRKNPSVSLLIDSREKMPTRQALALTITGLAERIVNQEIKERIQAKMLDRHPHFKNFIDQPDMEWICVKVESYLLLEGLTKAHFVQLGNS